jgi:glucose/arabinose dehydrogenase
MSRSWTSLLIACCIPAGARGAPLHLERIKLPAGFGISVYAENVPNAREMVLSPGGVLFVSTRRAGNVYAVLGGQHRNRADRVVTIARGLQNPNGVAFRNGALFPSSSATTFPPRRITGGSSSPSVPTGGSTCRSARPATSASRRRSTRRSRA